MKQAEGGSYHSPLRRAQVAATRDQILEALAVVLERGEEPTYGAIAAQAGVQERTVYRHFPSKEELHGAFWQRVHQQRIGVVGDADDLPSLLRLVGEAFDGFSRNDRLVRGMLHAPEGRAIRLGANDERRRRFENIAARELSGCKPAERRRAAAAAQVLASALSWEYLVDYWGMGPDEAASTVQQAITSIFRAAAPTRTKEAP